METQKNSIPITSWSEEDRPREKLLGKGRHVLSDAELIAILLGSGSRDETAVGLAKRILHEAGNNLNSLGKFSVQELMKFKGVGEAKAVSIVAAMELGRRRSMQESARLPRVLCSRDIYDSMKPDLLDLSHEEFWIVLLNRSNGILKKERISRGGISGTIADTRIIFKTALEHLACSLVLCHNHPSGNTKPSDADISLTKKLKEAGVLLEIPVVDHVIFTDSSYFSFADEGLL